MKSRACWIPALVFVAIALSRVPFLDAGYGTNIDGWRVARAARDIARSGQYEISRFPGSPVQEIICAPFFQYGPIGLNALSAAFSVLASIAIWQIARRLRCRDSLLIATAFAFTPIIFLSSVIAKDYVWAIAFVLLAFWALLAKRAIAAGVLLGLAVACRITSGAMLLPLALILFQKDWTAIRWRKTGAFVVTTLLASAACYLPVCLRYSGAFFTFYDNHARPDVLATITRASLELWGGLGLLGLTSAFALSFIGRKRKYKTSLNEANPMVISALGAMILLYLIAYLRLPDQPGYLVPIIPAVLFIAARFVPRPVFQCACITLLFSPWIDFSGTGPQPGMIIADYKERKKIVSDVIRFLGFAEETLPDHNIVVVGGWEPMIDILGDKRTLHNDYRGLLSLRETREAQESGHRIAYTSDTVRAFNFRETGVDLAEYGALDLRKLRIALSR